MKLVITEKPSAARDIARFLKANDRNDGFFKNSSYYVTWARGHCVTLADPGAYGFEKWRLNDLPIIPDQFSLKSIPDTKKELNTIKSLIAKGDIDELINATDAEREGELIFRLIYEYLDCKLPVKRLWLQNPTDEAIGKAFDNLKPGSDYDGYYWSAKSRSLADWLVGLNSTRAFTLASDTDSVLSIGRVQTPVLALICERFIINRDFKEVIRYHIKTDFKKDGIDFVAICELGKQGRGEVETIIGSGLENFTVDKIEVKPEKKAPPMLFDLGLAQQFANKHYNLTASDTLKVIQSLYEKKLVTYPRTDSNYLNSDMKDMVRNIQEKLAGLDFLPSEQCGRIAKDPLYEKPFNDSKVSDHHAIIPTGEQQHLSGNEAIVYEMIVKRFFAAFSSSREREMTNLTIKSGEYDFIAKGAVIKQGGWALIESQGLSKEVVLPVLSEGESLVAESIEPHQVKSKPPALFTDGTMISAMESAGKRIEDAEMRDAMKSRGLGTAATRDGFMELLIKRNYIERKGKSLVPTVLGLKVYDKVKDLPIANAELTGGWEFKLSQILKGEYDHEKFLEEIKDFTREITSELSNSGITTESIACPVCGKGRVKEGKKNYYCSRSNAEDGPCSLTIWKVVAKKKLSASVIRDLLEKGSSKKIKGFKSKASKNFDGALKLNKATGAVEFDFEGGQKEKK